MTGRLASIGGWIAGLCAGTLATGLAAQDRAALVIANSAYAGDLALPDVRPAGEDISETLFGLGFDVNRVENADRERMEQAIAEIAAFDGPAVIYFAGHAFAEGGQSWLRPLGAEGEEAEALAAASVPVADLLTGGDRIVVLDTCHGASSQALPGRGALDAGLTDAAAATPDLLLMTAAAPGVPCPEVREDRYALSEVLLERLTLPGLEAEDLLPEDSLAAAPAGDDAAVPAEDVAEGETPDEAAPDAAPDTPGLFIASTRASPFVFRPPTSGTRLSAQDYRALESLSPQAQAQLLAMWESQGMIVDFEGEVSQRSASPTVGTVENDTVVLVDPVRPVGTASTVAPVTVSAGSVGVVSDGVQVLAAPAPQVAARPRAVPGAGGLPAPSIIVGYPEEEVEASFEVAREEDTGPVSGSELSYENLEGRLAMRDENPTLYSSLVESGAFDPPANQIALALQTELKRMNCYTSVLDNDWGPGSRASVARYFEQRGEPVPTQDATYELWHTVIDSEDVRCPDVVVQQPAPQRQTSSSSSSSAPRQQAAAPAPTQQRRAAPAPAPGPGRTLSNTGGTGVFR